MYAIRSYYGIETGVPVLGICYGMQLMAHLLGGVVAKAAGREYGRAHLTVGRMKELFKGLGGRELSSGDTVLSGSVSGGVKRCLSRCG